MKKESGRGFAIIGFLLGITSSIASNVFHSYLASDGKTMLTLVGSLILSAFWPLSLYLCLEIMVRVAWPRGIWFWLARYTGLGTVAAIAAYVSFRHMHGLLVMFGEESAITYVAPIGIDSLMVLCSAALLAIADNIKKRATSDGDVTEKPTTYTSTAGDVPGLYTSAIVEREPATSVTRSYVPPPKPTRPKRDLPEPKKDDTKERNQEAVATYRESLANGKILTAEELGDMFRRSSRWGRDRISEAR
jgi:hypothetical protein